MVICQFESMMIKLIAGSKNFLSRDPRDRPLYKEPKEQSRLAKCTFATSEIDFLRFEISRRGIRASQNLTDKVGNIKPPSCVKEVCLLAGLLAFVHRHMPHLAQKVAIINQLLCKNTPFE